MGTYGMVLNALGDPTRRAILDALRHGPQSVGALAGELPVSRPAISQHLKVLGAAGLVDHESRGTRNLYRVEPAGLDPLRSWLDEFWGDVLEAFAAHIDRTKTEAHVRRTETDAGLRRTETEADSRRRETEAGGRRDSDERRGS